MKQYLLAMLSLLPLSAHAARTVADAKGLASVELHTEIVGSKRVYLAADAQALHSKGRIYCELLVDIQDHPKREKGLHLRESFSLLPGEKIPFNLGLFPTEFHASSRPVHASLKCQPAPTPVTKKLLKGSDKPQKVIHFSPTCCRLSVIKLNCTYFKLEGEPGINEDEILSSEHEVPDVSKDIYPSCWPEQ